MNRLCPSPQELERQLQNQFTDAGSAELEAHLSSCVTCRQVLDRLTSAAQTSTPSPGGDLTPECEAGWQAHQGSLQAAVVGQLCDGDTAGESPPDLPVIPGYQIEGRLGEGGMGVVYRARHERLQRPVALKMLRPGVLDRAAGRARFRREAEVLSRLHHSHIVQLFDFGETGPTATPYMVLELVEGGTLSDRVNHRPVPARTAAELLEILARALHAVHEQGIIHRDLKPGNILLQPAVGATQPAFLLDTGRLLEHYVPKLTDFGLAKQLAVEQSQWTHAGDMVGTPAYMAPEQASDGKDVTAAADVYGLGVILYELLTGLPPFRARDWVELVVQVKEAEAVPPSRLLPGIPKDLETICLKCLHKEPARRYTSAEALADDVHRFLNGQPILARPTGRMEKLWKWSRRNPWVAGLSAAVLMLLVVGLAVTSWLALLADRRQRDARTALNLLQLEQGRTREAFAAERRRREQARQALEAITSEMVPDWLDRGSKLTPEHRQFLTRALALYQEFARDTATDETSRAEVAAAQLRVAQFQRHLGQLGQAQPSAKQAQLSWEQLVQEFPGKPEYARSLATAYWNQAVLLRGAGRLMDAEEFVRKAVALNQRLLADFGPNPATENHLYDCLNTLGTILRYTSRLKQADEQFRALVPVRTQLVARFPHTESYGIGLVLAHLNLALVAQDTSRLKEADQEILAALTVAVPLAAEHVNSPESAQWLARCREVRGDILAALREPVKAVAEYQAAETLFAKLYGDYPGRAGIQRSLLHIRAQLKKLQSQPGRPADKDARKQS